METKLGLYLVCGKWHGAYRDSRGFLRRLPLSTDKAEAQAKLDELKAQANAARKRSDG